MGLGSEQPAQAVLELLYDHEHNHRALDVCHPASGADIEEAERPRAVRQFSVDLIDQPAYQYY